PTQRSVDYIPRHPSKSRPRTPRNRLICGLFRSLLTSKSRCFEGLPANFTIASHMATPSFYFYCYPWDLEDEGLEISLGRLAGEIGVDGITVAATETDIRMIRGRPLGGRRTFISPAGAHFQPDPAIHRGNRIRPIPASWMKSKNPLERIAKVAEKER